MEWRIQLRFSSLDTYSNSFEHKTYSGDQDLSLFHVLGSRPCCNNHLSINIFLWKYANKGCVERTLLLLDIAHISFHRFVTFQSKFVYFKIGGLSQSLPVLCKLQNESYGVFSCPLKFGDWTPIWNSWSLLFAKPFVNRVTLWIWKPLQSNTSSVTHARARATIHCCRLYMESLMVVPVDCSLTFKRSSL